jgi:hypothetical protein
VDPGRFSDRTRDADELEQLNQQISALAASIARHRDLMQHLAIEGKATQHVDSALASMTAMFRLYLSRRRSLRAKKTATRAGGNPKETA